MIDAQCSYKMQLETVEFSLDVVTYLAKCSITG